MHGLAFLVGLPQAVIDELISLSALAQPILILSLLVLAAANDYCGNVRHMLFMGPPYHETTSHEHMRMTGSTRVPLNLTMAQRLRSAITGRHP